MSAYYGNINGNVTGNVTGNVIGNVSSIGNTSVTGNVSIVGTGSIINGAIDVSNNMFINSKNTTFSGNVVSATSIVKGSLNVTGSLDGDLTGNISNNTLNVVGNVYTNIDNNDLTNLSIKGNFTIPSNMYIKCNKITTTLPTDTLYISDVSGNTNIMGTLNVTNNMNVNTNKFTVAAASGNTLIAGALDVNGTTNLNGNTNINGTLDVANDITVNTNKFSVASATGNTMVAGTLGVTGNTTIGGTLGVMNNVAINTNKFMIAAATGNTNIAGTLNVMGATNITGNIISNGDYGLGGNMTVGGTLGVIGATTLSGNTTINGTVDINNNMNINTNKFTVAAATGNTNIGGALLVTGASTLTGNTSVSGTLGVTNNMSINTNKFTVAALTGNTTVAGTLDVNGVVNLAGNTTVGGTLGVTNNMNVNTNKFTVAALTGNTIIAGTLDASGAVVLGGNTSIGGTLGVINNINVNTDKFIVTAATGNTTIAGTLGVVGNTTVGGTVGVTGNTMIGGTLGVVGDTILTGNTTVNGNFTASGITTLNGSTINIGTSGSTVNIMGNTNMIQTTELMVTDKHITLNKNGAAMSLGGAGIEFEENNSITGYIKIANDRSSYNVKMPNNNNIYTMMVKDASGNMDISGNFIVNTNKFTVMGGTGNTSIAGTMDISGNTTIGGTTTLVNTIVKGTMDISGNATVSGTTILSNTSIGGTMDVIGNTRLTGSLTSGNAKLANTNITGTMDISGNTNITGTFKCNNATLANTNIVGTMNISGFTSIGGGLNCTGNSTLQNTTISGTMDINGNTNITNSLACSGNTSVGGVLDVSGNINLTGALYNNGTMLINAGKITGEVVGNSTTYLYGTATVGTEIAPLNGGTINLDVITYPNAVIELSSTIPSNSLTINLYNGVSSLWTTSVIGKSGSIYIIEKSTTGRTINIDNKIKFNNPYNSFTSTTSYSNAYAVDVFNYTIPKTFFGVGSYLPLFKTVDQSAIIKWYANIKGNGAGLNTINQVTKSFDGGFYITGYFTNTSIVFNGSTNATMTNTALSESITNSGGTDGFIAKYDSLGRPQWAAKLGNSGNNEYGYHVTASNDGTVYVTGNCNNSTFTPFNSNGIAYATPISGSVTFVFVVKYSSTGTVLWAAGITGSNNIYSLGIMANNNGGCVVVGSYIGTTYCFEKNNGNSITLANSGSYDNFIVKYDTNGNLSTTGTGWVAHIGGTVYTGFEPFQRMSLNIMSNDDIIVSNMYESATLYIFDKTQTASTTSSVTLSNPAAASNGYSSYIVKYTKDGLLAINSLSNNFITLISSSSSNFVYTQTSCTLADGGFIISGQYNGGSINVYSTNNNNTPFAQQPIATTGPDIFIVKYNSDGIVQWVSTIRGSGTDYIIGCSQIADGGIVFTGNYTSSILTFYNSLNSPFGTTLANSGATDIFVAKYTNNGAVDWVARIAGVGNDYPYGGITTLTDNSMIVAGQYTSVSASLTIFDKLAVPYVLQFTNNSLYQFSTFTFTNASVTGINGPSLIQIKSAYIATSWTQNTSYLNMTTNGIQLWTVPKTDIYTITCAGASGGVTDGGGGIAGRGRIINTTVTLTKGSIIKILVGQKGGWNKAYDSTYTNWLYAASGGGGSFVVDSNNNPIIISGGGAGTVYTPYNNVNIHGGNGFESMNATTLYVTNGKNGSSNNTDGGGNAGGTNGNGAVGGSLSTGGGGLLSDGGNQSTPYDLQALGGKSFLNGGVGGINGYYSQGYLTSFSNETSGGGFGGGSGTYFHYDYQVGGGAGGGYSGGGSYTGNYGVGGGGGNYISGTNTSDGGLNDGHGYVTIVPATTDTTESFIVKIDPSALN